MLFSRWKVMTGLIGISVGGLAALAGQNSKPDVVANAPMTPMIPTAKPTSTSTELPPALPVDLLPALPVVPPPPAVKPASKPTIELPTLPVPESKLQEAKLPPTKPMDLFVLPVDGTSSGFDHPLNAPVTPPSGFDRPLSTTPVTPLASPVPASSLSNFTPPAFKASPTVPSVPPITFTPPSVPPTVLTLTEPSAPAVASPSKFRIVLRVGEGEPTFEVRHNDDLVMKVACDKVDIKSPEKGTGPSNVIATGKVRFVGFGAEGTCDSLSFLSGTGEVSLAGNVNVKVRDKIGRVESELNADKMQYKLDSTALTGVLKP